MFLTDADEVYNNCFKASLMIKVQPLKRLVQENRGRFRKRISLSRLHHIEASVVLN